MRPWIVFGLTGDIGTLEQLPDSVKRRLVCHVILNHLQDDALPEAIESLHGISRFYQNRRAASPALPAPSLPVEFGTPYVRPVFHISEE